MARPRIEGTVTGRMAHSTPNFEDVDRVDEGLGGDHPSIIQQCYNARRDLPRALGEYAATGAKILFPLGDNDDSKEFLRRMRIVSRLMKGFTPGQTARVRFYAALKGGAS